MKNIQIHFILLLFHTCFYGQVDAFKSKFDLPHQTNETSGLLFFNSKIITHNDSGDDANLYEIDSVSGNLLRTITISNANNIDWEDITEDETHIYIGDFGNNSGNRTDLKIYKISKADYTNNNIVTAEIISFNYEDQTDYTINYNNHNFDAEALVVYENSLLIFTKNWSDFRTNVYKVPIAPGNYIATKVSSANVEGLITGATILDNNFYLCGYETNYTSFLIYISFNRAPGDDIFSSGFQKESLQGKLETGSQVEAITSFDIGKYYISREAVNSEFGNLPQRLFEFKDKRDFLLSTNNQEFKNIEILQNPVKDIIYINGETSIDKVSIYNVLGINILEVKNSNEINVKLLPKGIYIVNILFQDRTKISKKVIKL